MKLHRIATVAFVGTALCLAASCGGSGGGGGGPAPVPAAGGPPASGSPGTTGSGAPAQPPPVSASGRFSVLTYNVAGLPQGISGSNPQTNTPLISPLLNSYDVVVVQEDFTYHALLVASSRHPYWSPPKPIGSRPVNDGLNQLSVLPFSGLERVQWASCHGIFDAASDCLAEKGFTYSRLEIAPGIEVDLYNLHAEAGGGLFDNTARADNFSQLASFIVTRSAGRALIVGGDTNLGGFDPVDEPVLQAFLGTTGLADACRTLGCPVETIDRILLRSTPALELRPVGHRVATEFVDAQGRDLSDHEAIHVDIEWVTVP